MLRAHRHHKAFFEIVGCFAVTAVGDGFGEQFDKTVVEIAKARCGPAGVSVRQPTGVIVSRFKIENGRVIDLAFLRNSEHFLRRVIISDRFDLLCDRARCSRK